MILKVKHYNVAAVGNSHGWIYVDGIEKAQTYGPLILPHVDGQPIAAQVFSDLGEVVDSVARMWGPGEIREFDYELWPEEVQDRTVEVVHLTRAHGGPVLALLSDEAFLLSDDGKTIDRLR